MKASDIFGLKVVFRLMGLSLLLGLVARPIAAQETTGAINGVVTDESRAVLPGSR